VPNNAALSGCTFPQQGALLQLQLLLLLLLLLLQLSTSHRHYRSESATIRKVRQWRQGPHSDNNLWAVLATIFDRGMAMATVSCGL